jgi:hypothetical protein
MRQAAKEEELKKKAVEEAEKKFASATAEQKAHYEQELHKLRGDLNWLSRASDAIVRHWQAKNARKGQNERAFGPHLQPVQVEQR